MNKSAISILAKTLAEKSNLRQSEAEAFVKQMFDVINEGLQTDKLVKVKWLGTFKVTSVKDRESVDVNTGERIVIEGRDKVTFTPDAILKEIVNKPFAQFETVVVNDGVDFSAIDEKFAAEEELRQQEALVEEEPEQELSYSVPMPQPAQPTVSVSKEEVAVTPSPAEQEKAEIQEKVEIQGQTEIQEKVEAQEEAKMQEEIAASKVQTPEPEEEPEILPQNVRQPVEQPVVQSQAKPQVHQQVQSTVEDPQVQPMPATPSSASEEVVEEQQPEYVKPKGYMVLPRYMVVVAVVLVLALIGGFGWFAFNYGKLEAQRDHLATQLNQMSQAPKPAPKPVAVPDSAQEAALRQKAKADSLRMAEVSEAVDAAEQANEKMKVADSDKQTAEEAKPKKAESKEQPLKEDYKKQTVADKNVAVKSHSDDPRIKTGAYTIVGVAQTITVKSGQTLSSISKKYLGPGMECYVEAINGTSEVKEGQKIKIPSLKLKKK